MIINFRDKKYKYVLASKKAYKKFTKKSRKKQKIKISEEDMILANMNFKIRYINKLLNQKDKEEAKKELYKLISEYNSNRSFFIKKHPENIKNKVKFIESKFLELKKIILVDENTSLNKKSNNEVKESYIKENKKSKKVSTQEEDENEETTEEFDVFVKIMKINQLIKEEKLDEAQEEFDRANQKIDSLDDIEKKKEKAFLLDKITPYKNIIEEKMKTSRKYKINKFIKDKKEFIKSLFNKENQLKKARLKLEIIFSF